MPARINNYDDLGNVFSITIIDDYILTTTGALFAATIKDETTSYDQRNKRRENT